MIGPHIKIFGDSKIREDIVYLRDVAYPQSYRPVRGYATDILPLIKDVAFKQSGKTEEAFNQGRLATTVRPDDAYYFRLSYMYRDTLNNGGVTIASINLFSRKDIVRYFSPK